MPRWLLVGAACFLIGCAGPKTLTLMPTPVIFRDKAVDPFAHIGPFHQSQDIKVFYATNRTLESKKAEVSYSNSLDSKLHLGRAKVRIGKPGASWREIVEVSLEAGSEAHRGAPLTVETIEPMVAIPLVDSEGDKRLSPGLKNFIDEINAELAQAVDKEVMVYVHGTKVDFLNSVSLTAELDHFAGRDFVGVAFAWPSHQNIFSYLVGVDVRRALDSSAALQLLLVLLADHTDAQQINVLSYSAGGRVVSKALHELRESVPELTGQALRNRFRLGAVAFAAADVPVDVFLPRLEDVSALADLVVLTTSDDDDVLKAGETFMGGRERAGTEDAKGEEEAFIVDRRLSNVEIIDVSQGKAVRGFDITGHHYWYRHPWTSSDMVFFMRTDLRAEQRGLSASDLYGIWFLSQDYPEKVRKAAIEALDGEWSRH